MTSSFFSNPEDELTVEELKSLGKLIPKIPGPKQWDTKYAPGRGEGRAAFTKSKRNLDAMLERDALRAKNKGNVGIGGTPQTRPLNWFDGGNNYASQPGTGQFIRLPEDMQTSERTAEDTIKSATKDLAVDLNKDRSVGATNARASLIRAAEGTDKRMGQAAGKGSVGKDLARIQEIRKEQIPTDTKQETQRVETKGSQTPYQSYTDIPFDKGIGVDTGIDYSKQPDWAKGKNLYQQSSTPNEQASSFAANMEQAAGGAMMSIAKVLLSEAMKSNKGAEPNVNESKGADKNVDTRSYVPRIDELQNWAWS